MIMLAHCYAHRTTPAPCGRSGPWRAVAPRGMPFMHQRRKLMRSNGRDAVCKASSLGSQQQQAFPDRAKIDWLLTLTLTGLSSAVVSGTFFLLQSKLRLAAATVVLPFLAFYVGRESVRRAIEVVRHAHLPWCLLTTFGQCLA